MNMRDAIRQKDGTAFPGKTFADSVLEVVFDVQRDYYYRDFLEISYAHVVMLHEQGIITKNEAEGIIHGLDQVSTKDFSQVKYNPAYEDMFFTIEKELERLIGSDLAGRMHIARSRNDIGLCEYRMALRREFLKVLDAMLAFMRTLLEVIQQHTDTVMPAYTHTQPAQPTTFAHYLLAFYDGLERSMRRCLDAWHNINRSPIGAAAITTTGFPINRERMCEMLGFDGLVENSYDCIAGVDYMTEAASSLMILGVDLSRFLKDTLDFCTYEYAFYRLADPYVQISSIMPQKRNPSSLEHARPIASQLVAEARTVFDTLHNTPFGDMVDSEEELQPHLYRAIENAVRVLSLLTSNYATMTVRKERMLQRANEGFIAATELADTLVREKGCSFREAHQYTSRIVRGMYERGLEQRDLTPDVVTDILGGDVGISAEMIARALDAEHFVSIRTITGGPGHPEVDRMIEARVERMSQWAADRQAFDRQLECAHSGLEKALASYR